MSNELVHFQLMTMNFTYCLHFVLSVELSSLDKDNIGIFFFFILVKLKKEFHLVQN